MKKMENDSIWELVVGKVNNSLDAEGEAAFEKIRETEEGQKAWRKAQQIYLKTSGSFLAQKIDKEKNWKYIDSQIGRRTLVPKQVIHFLKYAAVFIAALTIGVLAPKLLNYQTQQTAFNNIEVEWGQMGKMTLSDGTQVWLNAGTNFSYPTTFGTKKREVRLNGEAQFKVVQNSKAPFEVQTKSGVVKVHGTTFNVASYDDSPELIVTLIEGEVTVENNNGSRLATLHPSEQISINKITGEANLRKVNTAFYSSWVDGKILLNETKFSDLATILQRWYNVEISLVGNVGDIRISGTIVRGKSLDLFLKILERMYGIKYELIINANKKDEVTIYKN